VTFTAVPHGLRWGGRFMRPPSPRRCRALRGSPSTPPTSRTQPPTGAESTSPEHAGSTGWTGRHVVPEREPRHPRRFGLVRHPRLGPPVHARAARCQATEV
jgi:hypothetical protein